MATTTRTITIPQQLNPVSVLGPQDQVLAEIERAFPELTLIVRGNKIAILSHGKETESLASQAQAIIETLIDTAFTAPMDADTVRRLLSRSSQSSFHDLAHQWASDPDTRKYYQQLRALQEMPAQQVHSHDSSFYDAQLRHAPVQDVQLHKSQVHDVHSRISEQTLVDTSDTANTADTSGTSDTSDIADTTAHDMNHARGRLALDHTVEGDEIADATTSTLYQPPLFGVDRDESNDSDYAPERFTMRQQLTRQGAQLRVPGVITHALGAPVRPKTPGQIEYVNAIESHTITFGIGPAGTGKTYLAVAKAVRAFEQGQVNRIILTRPAVEAGENLGFLPGTLHEKVDPYLRPLYDALADMLGTDRLRKLMADGTIEVAPLAYMRGRTLNDAYVILDEAQNTTAQQMKMFLTRLGFNTRMVITGDATQVDLTVPHSGLADIEHILHGIRDIAFVHLQAEDVVRHRLVGQIVQAYERATAKSGDKR